MAEVLTIGEPMGLLVADEVKPLKDVEHYSRYVAGAEVNFAVGMARLGHKVAYVSKLGNDPFGNHIKDFLAENQIDNSYVTFDDEHVTGMQLKAKVEDGDPEVVNFRKNTASANMTKEDLAGIDWNTVRHIHLTGIPLALSATTRATVYAMLDEARNHDVQVSFDTNLRPALWKDKKEMVEVINDMAMKADIILPGINEGKILMGSDDPEKIADYYLAGGTVKMVVIKLGPKGAFVKTKEGSQIVDGYKVEHVVDTVGAGDGFAVGTISGLLEGLSVHDAVKRGTAIGALAVMSPGDNDGLPTAEGLKKFQDSRK